VPADGDDVRGRRRIHCTSMTSIKLSNVWRVIRDVDLERIRASARTPFELVVVADDADVADRVRTGLAALPGGGVHPYVVTAMPEDLRHRTATPLFVVLATAVPELSVAMTGADEHCIRVRWPRLTVVVGTDTIGAGTARVGERRVALADPLAPSRAVLGAIIDQIEGDARLAVAAALPAFRTVVAEAVVDDTAKANASFAATTGVAETVPVLAVPLNVGDMVVLTKNQLIMGYKIALASGRDDGPREMIREILGVIGGGFLFRQAARQLVGLIPVAGLVSKVAIAYAGTYAMGRALTAWALSGVEVTPETLSRYTTEGLEKGKRLAQQLVAQVKAGMPAPGRSWERLRGWLPSRRGYERHTRPS
jgi:uncharacterized protein (DUF697 family)